MGTLPKTARLWRKIRAATRCTVAAQLPTMLRLSGCPPIDLNLRLTHRCGAHCRTCTHWRINSRDEMTTAQWQQIIVDARKLGAVNASLTGGDIFCRDDAMQILAFATAQGLSVGVTLNGYNIDDQRLRALMAAQPAAIRLSLDDLGDAYSAARGVQDAAATVVDTLGRLNDHNRQGIPIGIAATVMRDTLGSIREVAAFALQHQLFLSLNVIHFNHYFSSTPYAKDQYDLDEDKRNELHALLAWLSQLARGPAGVLLPPVDHLAWIGHYFDDFHCRHRPCYKPLLKPCIDPNGDVRPCCSMAPVGNLQVHPLRDLVRSEAYLNVVHKGLRKECPGCSCHYALSLDYDLFVRLNRHLRRDSVASPLPPNAK